MTHGDFDEDYLLALALGPDGRPRLPRLSFAGHFDMLMFGRRGIERPPDEASLNPYRKRFADMFARLKKRARGAVLPGAQHDRDTAQRRPDR